MANSNGKSFAVVTGASSGIGKELAQGFAQHGFDLLVTSAGGRLEGAGTQTIAIVVLGTRDEFLRKWAGHAERWKNNSLVPLRIWSDRSGQGRKSKAVPREPRDSLQRRKCGSSLH